MEKNIKGKVRAYYGGIAKKVRSNSKVSCGCGTSCCGDITNNSNIYTKEYLEGLPEDAVNASLGCANPVVLAALKKGETVLDLGSGGGIDVFISSKYVGEEGEIYGLDMTDEMLELANRNKEKMKVKNVEFIKGYIEDIKRSAEMWVGCIAGALDIKVYENILKKVGFKKVEVTLVNLYTKEIIEEIAKQKNLGDLYSKIDAELLDGAYACAHVKAYK